MPLYEYICVDCRSKFELLRSMGSSGEDVACPQCQGQARRAISLFASFSTDASGGTTALGGDSCSSCATGRCESCAV